VSEWAQRWSSQWTKTHANGVVTHGSTEPVLTVLDVRGVELRELFLIGFNDNCGSIIVPTEARANEIKAALEPAFQVAVSFMGRDACWEAKYDRRHMDGSVPSWLVREITMKDGTVVMRDGRWVR
jgi:ribosomal protein L23